MSTNEDAAHTPYGSIRWISMPRSVAIERLALGHTSAIKPVGEGVSEYRIDFGLGYRIYFGREGDQLVILIGGGTKKRQQSDIAAAKAVWKRYKQRKKE